MQQTAEAGTIAELINQKLPTYDPHDVNPPNHPHFHSQFGGLWTDLSNAHALLAGKIATGAISQAEGRTVGEFIKNGYALLPRAVEPALVDRVLDDYESIVSGKFSGKHPTGTQPAITSKPPIVKTRLQKEAKILDMHEASEAAQQAIFCPAISRF